jgi:hypothetical protein
MDVERAALTAALRAARLAGPTAAPPVVPTGRAHARGYHPHDANRRRPMMQSTIVRAAWAVALSVLPVTVTTAIAGTPPIYQPMQLGWQWIYSNDKITDTVTIERSRTILGVATTTRRSVRPTETTQTFWTADGDGNVFLHGAENLTFSFFVAYDPPIQWLDLPLLVGKTWTETVDACVDGETPPCGSSVSYGFSVASETQLTVPLGTFDTFQIQVESIPPAAPRVFDLLGRRVSETGRGVLEAEEWVSAGSGIVQYRDTPTGTLFRLTDLNEPTPTAETTWSRIKGGFHRTAP